MENRSGQGLLRQRGVVLRRKDSPEGNRSIYALLEKEGPVWLLAPGAARGKVRFGGSTDPLVWGTFHVYRGPNSCYLREVDVRKDFWSLRSSPEKIRQAVGWSAAISRYTLPGHPCDDLLPIFFWSLCLLEAPGLRKDLLEWRFYWRWLRNWGLAPDLRRCQICGSSNTEVVFSRESLVCRSCDNGNIKGIMLKASELRDLYAAANMGHEEFMKRSGDIILRPEIARSCTVILENTLSERT